MMKIGFYPGCSMKGGSREYLDSLHALALQFEIELIEIPDWNCCGATAAHNLNRELALSLPARIMALAEKEGFSDIVVPCAACYSRLATTKHELQEDPSLAVKISTIIEMPYSGSCNILNIIQFIEKHIEGRLPEKVVKPLPFHIACYYGCLLVRPHSVLKFDRQEQPESMDNLIRAAGGTPIDWAFKTECCGAGLSVSRTGTVARLSGEIVKDAIDRHADMIVVACPMCHSNLDMRRPEINRYLGKEITLPVLYISQVLGLAVGLDHKTLGLQRHMTRVQLSESSMNSSELSGDTQETSVTQNVEA